MKYERQGVLAVRPTAFGEFFSPAVSRDNIQLEDATVVRISGPLTQAADVPWLDSYDAVAARTKAALEGPAATVILRINSPGGDAQGAFDCARALREMTLASGKRLIAYVDEACSAAYALASAASEICCSQTALLGSIGVLMSRLDCTAQDAMRGLRVALVTSGVRKADGHPDSPVTDGELAAMQQVVDYIAEQFFVTVQELRPGLQAARMQAMQAGVYAGQQAVAVGLADRVCAFEQSLVMTPLASKEGGSVDLATLMQTLAECVESGDEGLAKAARAALGAIAATEDVPAEEPKPEAEPEEPAAEGGTDEPKAEDEQDKPKAAAELAVAKAQIEKLRLLAKRSDLPEKLRTTLEAQPLEQVQALLAAMPIATKKPPVVTTVKATLPATKKPAELDGEARRRMDAAMGLAQHGKRVNKVVSGRLYLNVPENWTPRRIG